MWVLGVVLLFYVAYRVRSSTSVPQRAPRRDPVPDSGAVDWKKLSREFVQILEAGDLEPTELHARYHRELGKVGRGGGFLFADLELRRGGEGSQ